MNAAIPVTMTDRQIRGAARNRIPWYCMLRPLRASSTILLVLAGLATFVCADDGGSPSGKLSHDDDVHAMLLDLFGSRANLKLAASKWAADKRLRQTSVVDAWPDWSSIARLRHPAALLWWRLTRILGATQQIPFNADVSKSNRLQVGFTADCVPGEDPTKKQCLPPWAKSNRSGEDGLTSAFRAAKHAWIKRVAIDEQLRAFLQKTTTTWRRCGETGDGHYLRKFYPSCERSFVLDKFSKAAQIRADWNEAPDEKVTPASVRAHWGTLELLISHDVFEHLERPEVAMANFNALLSPGGVLVWSAPLVAVEHPNPGDWHRFTTRSVRRLFEGAGFEIKLLQGLGGMVSTIAYLAAATEQELAPSELEATCDATKLVKGCDWLPYSQVVAIGVKVTEIVKIPGQGRSS